MIFTIIERCRSRRPRHVHLALPTYISKGYIMKALILQNDAQAIIEPKFADMLKLPIAAPSTIGTATSSDPTLFKASINSDGNVLVIAIPGATGTGTLTYENGRLTDSGDVLVGAPVAQSVVLDSEDAVITAQMQPAAPATLGTA